MNARAVLFAVVCSAGVSACAWSSEPPRREAAGTIAAWMHDALAGSRKTASPVVGLEVRRQDYGRRTAACLRCVPITPPPAPARGTRPAGRHMTGHRGNGPGPTRCG